MKAKVKDVSGSERNEQPVFVMAMEKFIGKEIEINPVANIYGHYEGEGWTWLPSWLEFKED